MSSPIVTVIIPTHNRAPVLFYALHSVFNQTLQDFEVIVVDDASTDETSELIAKFDDPRLTYIKFEENRKAAAARNAGMQVAKGKYIAFLDSDDEWLPQKLERQVELMEGLPEEWALSYTGAYVSKTGGFTRDRVYRPTQSGDLLAKLLMGDMVIWTPTFMFRRSCLDKIGLMDESLARSQDVDFYIRLLKHYKLKNLPEPLVRIYLELNKNLAKTAARSRQILLDKHRDLIDELPTMQSRYVYAMASLIQAEMFLMEGETRVGLRYIFQALKSNPFLPVRRYVAIGQRIMASLFVKPTGTAEPRT